VLVILAVSLVPALVLSRSRERLVRVGLEASQ